MNRGRHRFCLKRALLSCSPCAIRLDHIPQHDSRCDQAEAAGPVALLLEIAVADFAKAVGGVTSAELFC